MGGPLQPLVSPRRLHVPDSKDIFKLALGDQVRNNFFHTFSTQLINQDHVCGPEVLAIQTFTSTLILLRQCQKILVGEKRGHPFAILFKRYHDIGVTIGGIPLTRSPLFSFDPEVIVLHLPPRQIQLSGLTTYYTVICGASTDLVVLSVCNPIR